MTDTLKANHAYWHRQVRRDAGPAVAHDFSTLPCSQAQPWPVGAVSKVRQGRADVQAAS